MSRISIIRLPATWCFLLFHHDVLHAGTGDVLHHQNGLAFGRGANLEGLDHFGVFHLHCDLALGRLVQALESTLEQLELLNVENLNANELVIAFPVFGDEEVRHRARRRGPLAFESSLDIDLSAAAAAGRFRVWI